MAYLLDTHTFLWFITNDPQLSKKSKKIIENPDTNVFVSIASIWEIAIKYSLGKLELSGPLEGLKEQMELNGFELLSISFDHTWQLSKLKHHHGDPFDRIIIAQAIAENFTVIGKDKNFPKYENLMLLW